MKKEERIKQLKRRKAIIGGIALGAGLAVAGVGCAKKISSKGEDDTTKITIESTSEEVTEDVVVEENQYIDNLLNEYNIKSGKNISKEDLGIVEYDEPIYIYYTVDENGNKLYKYDIYKTNQDSSITSEQIVDKGNITNMYVYIDQTDDTLVGSVGQIREGTEKKAINIDVEYVIFNDKNYYPSSGYLKLDDEQDYIEAKKYMSERQEYLNSKNVMKQ